MAENEGPKQEPFDPTWALIKKPQDWPEYPAAGKIEMIIEANSKSIYHRLSPYTEYDTGLIKGFTKEPFFWTWIDQKFKSLAGLRKYESRLFPMGSAPIDVIRVSKFLGSGRGITFLGKQFLLQTGNAYNETRIYNPTSPIVAAGMGLTFNTARPNRNFDTSAGLAGIAGSLLGGLGSAIFGKGSVNPPSGTTGTGALPDVHVKTDGKGLLRAATANKGKSNLEQAWGGKGTSKGFFASLFSNFLPSRQDGSTKFRSDEGGYGTMILGGDSRFVYTGAGGATFGFSQRWVGGSSKSDGIRKKGEYPAKASRIFVKYDNGTLKIYENRSTGGFFGSITGVGNVGYGVKESTDELKPGYRYGDSVGAPKNPDYEASDIMWQYKQFVDTAQKFPVKDPEVSKTKKTIDSLRRVYEKIAAGDVYQVASIPQGTRVVTSPDQKDNGYDRLFRTREQNQSPSQYPEGVLQSYRGQRVVDDSLKVNGTQKSLRLSTAGRFDAINTLEVIDGDELADGKEYLAEMKGWSNEVWKPYEHDQIAFYFHDIVNDKYIPFRAAVSGIVENGNASWEEMPIIGRGDKVYSYGGFNRNLSFTIRVVISSIVELAPTWQRINYLTTLIKPANYTTSDYEGAMNRFMVPPMVMLTMGDLYKNQPVLVQSVTTTVPEDAIWETQHQFNNEEWNHLAGLIKSRGVLFGQLPRTVDLGIGLILLEKERAVVGGANFGHAPRGEQWERWNGSPPTKLHESFVVRTVAEKEPPPYNAGTPYQSTIDRNAPIA